MADGNRRPGDWQRRDLRESANDLEEEPNAKAWHRQTFWIVFFLLIFWPVGIVLCWKSDWHVAFKILATVLIAFFVYFSVAMSQAVMSMQAAGLV